jgi:uncharacterized protein YbjT (DUF2867 family)
MSRMILVTGATGTIGGEVVRLLAGRGERVRAMTRTPARQRPERGVEVVYGDYTEPDSLAAAATGVSALFLLSAPGPALPAHDTAMLAAAVAAGVRTVVKLSNTGAADPRLGGWHRPGEQAVRDSGLTWTIVRPPAYASNALRWAAAVRAGEPVPNLTGSGTQGVVDPRDVAAVAVAALTARTHDGRTYTVTGPRLLSVPDQVAVLGEVLRRDLRTVDVPPDAARAGMLDAGMDPAFVDVVIAGAAFVAAGGDAVLTDDVARVTGRPPRDFRTWVGDHRAAFEQ